MFGFYSTCVSRFCREITSVVLEFDKSAQIQVEDKKEWYPLIIVWSNDKNYSKVQAPAPATDKFNAVIENIGSYMGQQKIRYKEDYSLELYGNDHYNRWASCGYREHIFIYEPAEI